MLGYCTAVVARVRAAEEAAVASASGDAARPRRGGQSAALVLADRSLVVRRQVAAAYPRLRKTRVTYSGGGYGDGYREGQKADIGGAKLRSRTAGASAADGPPPVPLLLIQNGLVSLPPVAPRTPLLWSSGTQPGGSGESADGRATGPGVACLAWNT